MPYDFTAIERRWQDYWASHRTFHAPNPGEAGFDPAKPKFYVLDMFPYPSGVGLHVGHPLGYIATDIVARYKRMRGFNVLHPMGYDAFGLPAEQFAVEHGVHPRVTTEKNIANMTRQLKLLGLSYDWERTLSTTDPEYYRWTQWIFLQLFNSYFDPVAGKARPVAGLVQMLESEEVYVGPDGEPVLSQASGGIDLIAGGPIGARKWFELTPDEKREFLDRLRLAYLDEVPVNWCPALGTVLANEEVTSEGRSERGNHPVFKRPLRQWMLRITAYAERLLADLDRVDWPEPIKLMQRNWIGRSEGARVDFALAGSAGTTDPPEDDAITVFTTRPDTLFGATYLVLAPEHPLVESITTGDQYHAVTAYQRQAAAKTEADRQAEASGAGGGISGGASGGASGGKTGVFTGAYAVNPVNGGRVPVWIADYVLMGYGTGAIMAVPAHDQRDFDFARALGLPVRAVVLPDEDWLTAHAAAAKDAGGLCDRELTLDSPAGTAAAYLTCPEAFGEAFTGSGTAANSGNAVVSLDGLPTPEAKRRITEWLEAEGFGRGTVQYKLRDWLFSRQRYWGEPFPILHGPGGEIVALDESELPVLLPEMDDFTPSASDDPTAPPRPPLARAPEAWRRVERRDPVTGETVAFHRELNTMPQWAGSCWYYLRFLDPGNRERLVGETAERYWMVSRKKNGEPHAGGVDLYVGGVEHAVLHLLYARFWHKALYDLGHLGTPEPFGRLFNQGYIQAYAYTDERGVYLPADEVEEHPGRPTTLTQLTSLDGAWKPVEHRTTFYHRGKPVRQEFGKMGKGLKNAIAPDAIAAEYGCDTLRLYEMYLGPLDQSKVWQTRDIVGLHRFLGRLWRNFEAPESGEWLVVDGPADEPLRRSLHKTIKRVSEAMESMAFNVAIAALIEFNNELVGRERLPRQAAETLVLLLSPLAPHVAEELWRRLGHAETLAYAPWPTYDPALLTEDQIEYPVQVNGKLRGRVRLPAAADEKALEMAALSEPSIRALLGDKTVRKVIVVKGRLLNLVAS